MTSDGVNGLADDRASGGRAAPGEGARDDHRPGKSKLGSPKGRLVPTPAASKRANPPRPFRSILFDRPPGSADPDEQAEPAFFSDLNLDQIVEAITAGRQEYELKPLLYRPLGDADAIHYRHEIIRDLEDKTLLAHMTGFAQKMRDMRECLVQAGTLHYKYQRQSRFLDAVHIYCDAVCGLARDLAFTKVTSRGLLAFREYLATYVDGPGFTATIAETKKLKEDLCQVSYCLHIKGNRISVRKYDSEVDYSADVQRTFERFKQGTVKDYRVGFSNWPEMNHVEAAILDLVARLFSEIFAALGDYCAAHRDYLDGTIRNFDREVQFYIAYLEYIEQFKSVGLNFCYPDVSRQTKDVFANETFDLALANRLVAQGSPVVSNDFHLHDPERIFVVSGPNQGGKTTFARTFGQLHHLASIGYPVPGRAARLFLFDRLFCHFEREEDLTNLSGKLEDDLVRIRDVLREATPDSILIMNELFTSTTLKDALFLGAKVMAQIIQLDVLCVYVTFIDELASLSESTVSMVSTVVPENPAQRTYKVV